MAADEGPLPEANWDERVADLAARITALPAPEAARLASELQLLAAAASPSGTDPAIVAALDESRQHLALALDAAQMGVWDWDIAAGTLRWSPQLEMLHGLAPGAFPGTYDAFMALILPDDRAHVTRAIAAHLEQGREFRTEYRIGRADGTTRWIAGQGRAVRDGAGRPMRMLGVGLDVTDRRRAEEEARRQAARLAMLADASRAFAATHLNLQALMATAAEYAATALGDLCILDLTGDEQRAGESVAVYHADAGARADLTAAAARMTHPLAPGPARPPPADGESRRVPDVAPEALRAMLDPALHSYLDRHPAHSLLIVPLRSADRGLGALLMLRDHTPAPYAPDDEVFLQDLAGRAALALENAQLLRATREAEQRLRFLADASGFLTGTLDVAAMLAGLTRSVVPVFADWCAIDLVDREGEHPTALAHTDPDREAQVRALWQHTSAEIPATWGVPGLLTSPVPVLVEHMPALTPDTADALSIRALLDLLAPHSFMVVPLVAREHLLGVLILLRSTPGPAYTQDDLALARVLGRRAALAIDNARLYQAAQEAVQLRDQFLSIASHELRAPLTTLLASAQMMQRRATRATPALEHDQAALDRIVEQARHMSRMVDVLLDLGRIETGQLTIEQQPLDLTDLLRRLIAEQRSELARHQLAVHLPPGPVPVAGDDLRLGQVFRNLLQNAAKYTPAGGAITVELTLEGDTAVVRVADTGIGIPASALPQLFGRFFRAPNAAARTGGLGIGLHVVKEIVTRHGGVIEVDSVEGAGSTFTARLPRLAPATAPD